jgi:hypothetical protein
VDPDIDETGHPYAYTGDDPVNDTDPSGSCDPAELDSARFIYVEIHPGSRSAAYVSTEEGDLAFEYDYSGRFGFRWSIDLTAQAQLFLGGQSATVVAKGLYAVDGKSLSNPTYSKLGPNVGPWYPFHSNVNAYSFPGEQSNARMLTPGHTLWGYFTATSNSNHNLIYFNWKAQIFRS